MEKINAVLYICAEQGQDADPVLNKYETLNMPEGN